MAVNQDAGWGRFDNLNEGRSTMPAPPPQPVVPNKAPRKTTVKKKITPQERGLRSTAANMNILRGSLQTGLNQAQQGAFSRGPAGYAQAGMMANRMGHMLSYDMPQQSAAPPKKERHFGQALGHAVISTLQFANQVRLGAQGRGPGQPNERRKPATPFAGNRSGTTKPYGRSSVYGILNQSTY